MNSHPVAAYLADCRARHKTGAVTPETSYYGPLESLFNAVGQKLKKPRLRCFMSLQNQSGNMPDGGLFTQDQIFKAEDDPLPGQEPARGVIEAKPFANDLAKLAAGTQVGRYWQQYHQVLVTNFREFSLIGRDHLGKPVRHEFYFFFGRRPQPQVRFAARNRQQPEVGDPAVRRSESGWDRVAMAIQEVRDRLLRCTAALEAARLPYVVVGGNAVAE